VFVVWGPAAAKAGPWLLAAVALAAVVAAINGRSTALLAARHPVAGGAYTYGRRELGHVWGFVAGIGFVVGKTASVAAMALAIGSYVWPSQAPGVASLAIVVVWAVNARGVMRTARATTVLAAGVLVGLAVVVAVSLTQDPGPAAVVPHGSVTVASVASAAALVFFAFAGYARLATLGEEVRDPARTIPRAVAIAIGVVVTVYLVLGAALLRRPGVGALAGSHAPLSLALPDNATWRAALALLAAVAAAGAMVALMAGIGRTAMAMAREGDLPHVLAAVGVHGAPQRAEAVGAAASIMVVWWGDVGFALAMSSVSVLLYYAVANAAAFAAARQADDRRLTRQRFLAGAGVASCLVLALSLDLAPTVAAVAAMAVAVALRAIAHPRRS